MKTKIKGMLSLFCVCVNLIVVAEPRAVLDTPLLPAETASPRDTLFGFINDGNQAYTFMMTEGRANATAAERELILRRIEGYLDLEALPEYIRKQATRERAIALKEVLDRVDLPLPEDVPGPGETASLSLWRVPNTNLQIVKMESGPNQGEYVFSAATVAGIVDIYERVKHLPLRVDGPATSPNLMKWYRTEPSSPWVARLIEKMPNSVRTEVFGHTLWQLIGLVLLFAIGLFLMVGAYKVGRKRAAKFKDEHIIRYLITLTFPVTAMLIPLLMKSVIKRDLALTGELLRVTDFVLGLMVLMTGMRLIWAVGNRLLALMLNHPKVEENQLDLQLVRLVGRVLTVAVVVVVFLEGGKRLGIPLTTLVAGAGISGLAVALAAQDSLKNILGSVMLILDKPFRVGDRIIAKGYQGFVHEIGLRSTKVKLLSGNLASIPNEALARLEIENVSMRPSLKKVIQLHVPLDTPWQKTHKALERIREVMQNHEGMPEDQPPRVFLDNLNQVSCVIQVMFWYAPPKTLDMMAFSEKVMFDMLKIAEEEGVELRMPFQLPPPPPPI